MSKRVCMPHFYYQKKKLKVSDPPIRESNVEALWNDEDITLNACDLPSDTESAFILLRSKFLEKCKPLNIPPVVLVHQIYSIVKCRTTVDKDLRMLQTKGKLRMFKLGGEESVLVVLQIEDLHELVAESLSSKLLMNRFLKVIMPAVVDVCVDKALLTGRFCLSEKDITDLMNGGLLTARTVSSYWFSFPRSGDFMRMHLRGRKAVIRAITRCKFNEILQHELEQRQMEKSVKFGMFFYVHDIIGAELVECTDTTSGPLLRLKKKGKKKKNV